MHDLTLRDAITDLPSFGGKSLIENVAAVDDALAKTKYLQDIFNKSHSQWAWRHLTISYLSPTRNLRQIAAELDRKRGALWEAKWRCIERHQDIDELNEQIKEQHPPSRRLELALQRKIEEQAMATTKIEGAMKDVLTLSSLYDDLIEKYDIRTEADFEANETYSHLCRSLIQALRDIRQYGIITSGNQEYLEQIGIVPTKVLLELKSRIEHEAASDEWGTRDLHDYICNLAKKLEPYAAQRMELMGFTNEPINEGLMLNGKTDKPHSL